MGSGVTSSISPPETCRVLGGRSLGEAAAGALNLWVRVQALLLARHPNSGREISTFALEVWSSRTTY